MVKDGIVSGMTHVKIHRTLFRPLYINRGVQGSPVLFIVVMDDLLKRLVDHQLGPTIVGGGNPC